MYQDRISRKLKQLDEMFPVKAKISWKPFPGAQSLAYHCSADETWYG
jgi:hypothetical protein